MALFEYLGGMGWHDVRDVAAAHILAGTKEAANGRYLPHATSHPTPRSLLNCNALGALFRLNTMAKWAEPLPMQYNNNSTYSFNASLTLNLRCLLRRVA